MAELIRALASGRRPRPRAFLVPLLAVTLLCLVAISVRALDRADSPGDLDAGLRTITLVARDMSFFVDGQPMENPRLVVERGELLRFVLVNDDPGMAHDLRLPSLGAATRLLKKSGMSAELTLRAPQEPGEHEYLCSLHARFMRGVLEVR